MFDLGGVLVRIARDWPEAADFAGISLTVRDEAAFKAARTRAVEEFQCGLVDEKGYCAAVAAGSFGDCSVEAAGQVLHAWSQEEYPGIATVFDALDEAGVPAALLSNTNASHWRRLAGLDGGALEYPTLQRARFRHASHLLGFMKPDPRVYRAFEVAVGLDGERLLFFDDVEENVLAAREAGWLAEHIEHGVDTPGQLLGHLRRHGVVPERDAEVSRQMRRQEPA